jgi:hypothetical protein
LYETNGSDFADLLRFTCLKSTNSRDVSRHDNERKEINMNTRKYNKAMILIAVVILITAASTRLKADTGTCGGVSTTLPFTDVLGSNTFFCAIAEAYVTGLTNGTSATTYSPNDPVTREQMAAFVTRSMDQSLKRGSRRAGLDQFWTTQGNIALTLTTVGTGPQLVKSDGADLWVANAFSGSVSRVRASDGAKLGADWTGAQLAIGVLVAMGKVFVAGGTNPGGLYQIDPTQPPGPVTPVMVALGNSPRGIAFDGQRIWTANLGSPGSVSIITLSTLSTSTITAGFSAPEGIVYDGTNMWVTDAGDNKLKKLDSSGNIIVSVSVGSGPRFPMFDGTNIWVPNNGWNSLTVVRAIGGLTGTVLSTLTANGLNEPLAAAFDGERVLVTGNNSVSLWKASDLSPIGTFATGASTGPFGVCSSGPNFWITFSGTGKLARF